MNWIIKLILRLLFSSILPVLIDLAKDAVMKVKEDPASITDEEKRKKAFEQIAKEAQAKGIQAGANLINLAIEMAVAATKKYADED